MPRKKLLSWVFDPIQTVKPLKAVWKVLNAAIADPRRQLWLVDDFSWLDPDVLAGFPEQAADILDECPGMTGRTDFVYEGVHQNVDKIIRMLL
jgi:hypothetical protein